MNCTPSQKSKDYSVMLVFNKETGEYCSSPASRCECTAGNLFCGHMLALILCIHLIQNYSHISFDTFRKVMPDPVKSFQSYAIPFSFIFSHDSKNNLKGGKLSKLSKVLSKTNINNKDTWLTDEDEDWKELIAPDIDRSVLNILKNIDTYFADRLKNSSKINGDSTKHMTLDDINTFNDSLLSSGPNNSTVTKLEQLKMFKRLHEKYLKGDLDPCLLSYWLSFPDNIIDINEMIDAIENGTLVVLERHLLNVPIGWIVLADRGFAYDCFKYPNMNKHITPHFIKKREQFTSEEIEKDKLSCTCRYISETVFSRMTDVTSLQGIIPFSYFNDIPHILSWSKGRANLLQPMYEPTNYSNHVNNK